MQKKEHDDYLTTATACALLRTNAASIFPHNT